LSRRPSLIRTLLASAAVAAAFALAGCETDGVSIPSKALKELSPEMLSALEQKRMPKESPILVRLFKEDAELEIWKQDESGRFALLKSYPICRWSGELGPKIKEGDRQAPEGFYTITPGQMNPNSSYFLSFNLGYPNAFDKSLDRTGAHLMVHGDCSSRGCYAMTDEQIVEIYALARESFFGGQKSFQVQAYPFRMTPLNMAKHRNSPHLAFWRMLKEGNDHFELSRREPKVEVCEKRYVFDAAAPANATQPLRFDPRGKCPVYEVPQELAKAVRDKQSQDEREFAELVTRGTATVAVRTGTDGGMHPTFLAKLKAREISDSDGRMRVVSTPVAPMSMGNNVVPPRESGNTGSVADGADAPPRNGPQRKGASTAVTAVAAEDPSPSDRLFGNLFKTASAEAKPASPPPPGALATMGRWIGLRGPETVEAPQQTPAQTAAAKPAKPAPAAAPANTGVTASITAPVAGASRPQPPKTESQQKVAEAPDPQSRPATNAPAANPASGASLMSGAQPVLPSSSFDSRWGGLR